MRSLLSAISQALKTASSASASASSGAGAGAGGGGGGGGEDKDMEYIDSLLRAEPSPGVASASVPAEPSLAG